MQIDYRALEPAHVFLAIAMTMVYLLERDIGASRRTATCVCLVAGIALLLLR